MEGPPDTLIDKHMITLNPNIMDDSICGQIHEGTPQNMDG